MEAQFLVEVDELGFIVSVEDGERADVPEGLLANVSKLVSARVDEARFVWQPELRGKPCAVRIVPSVTSRAETSTVFVQGEWTEKLPFGLTLRELDVLTLLVFGLPSAQIAERLSLSTRTVTTHIDRVMRKMGVFSRTAAATLALDEGLIRVPFPGESDEAAELLRLGRSLQAANKPRDAHPRVVRKALTIGAALPLVGSAAFDGIEMARASQLAVDELNERGGIGGRRIALEIVDVDIFDESSVARAIRALTEQEVDVVTSGYLAHQEIAHEMMAESGISYLHAATLDVMAQRVREDPGRYGKIFQVCASDSNYAPRFVEMMSQLRDRGQWVPSSNRLMVVQAAWGITDLGLSEASAIAERDGWVLEIVQSAGGGSQSWKAFADQTRRTEPAALMLGNYLVEDTVAFLEKFLYMPSRTLVYSLYAPSVPQFRETMGQRADGLLWATVTGTYSDPRAKAFAARYRERFGLNPGRSHAGIAYDRVRLIANAWAFAENPRDQGQVSAELRELVYRGVNGVYHLGDPSQTALTYPGRTADPSLAQAHLVFQIQGGKQRIIDPAPYADASFMVPPWFAPHGNAPGLAIET